MVLREAPGGGAEQNPELAEPVLSRHRCVPKIASRETKNPENRKHTARYYSAQADILELY